MKVDQKIQIAIIVAIVLGLTALALIAIKGPKYVSPPSHAQAESVGFGFMSDFIALAPPSSDTEALNRAYDALSKSARSQIMSDNLASELALFVGVQDVPDGGISVEDLQITGKNTATLVVGMNYSGGRVIRHVNLVVEKNQWKVDSITNPSAEKENLLLENILLFAEGVAGVSRYDMGVVSVSSNDWPNSCLGLAEEDEFCAEVIVPGYEFILDINGEQRVFRTDLEGIIIREAK